MRTPKQQKPLNDLSRSLTPFDPNQTLIAVIELSQKCWHHFGRRQVRAVSACPAI